MRRLPAPLRLPPETWLLALAVPALGFLSEILLFPQMWRLTAQGEAVSFVVAMALGVVIHEALRRHPRLWIVVVVPAVLAADIAQSLIEVQLMALAAQGGDPGVPGYALPATPEAQRMMLALRLQGNLLEFGFFAAAVSLIVTQRAGLEAKLRSQAAELEVLRLQLAPHFLMNAFSSLLALIETDQRRDAARMVSNLAGFFRSVLLSSHQRSTTLAQELESLDDYLAIEQTRYGDRLRVETELAPAAADVSVPPMLLQPLVENVVHHVVAHTSRPVALRIAAQAKGDAVEIRVTNTVPPDWRPAHRGTGAGQRNVAERLALTYGPAATLITSLDETAYEAVIRIPPGGLRPAAAGDGLTSGLAGKLTAAAGAVLQGRRTTARAK